MPTGTTLALNVLKSLALADPGGGASASDIADTLAETNRMLDEWSADNTLVYSTRTDRYPLTGNANPYAIGSVPPGFAGGVALNPGVAINTASNGNPATFTSAISLVNGQTVFISGFTGNWAPVSGAFAATVIGPTTFTLPFDSSTFGSISGTPIIQTTAIRPSRIDSASCLVSVGSGLVRTRLRPVSSPEYFSHVDPATSATSAEEIYNDYAEPYSNLYLFPVPSCLTPTILELETWTQLTQLLPAVFTYLPPGYESAIQYGAAWRMITWFGISDAAIIQKIEQLGKSGQDTVRQLNSANRMIPMPQTAAAPAPQPGQ